MLRDITLGQYFPGNSPLHRADPRFKIILTIIYIVALFLAKTAAAYLLMIAFTLVMVAVSRIPLKIVFRGFKALIFIIAFTSVLNIFWTKGDHLLFEFKFIKVYAEGIFTAVTMVLRLICLLIGSSVLVSYTTSPISLTYGIERLLAPLAAIKLPVHEFSMMMTIALRFIPTLIEETDKIMSAQKARGADFTSGNLIQRAKALIPILIPLFVSAFRRADELAVAMECRCYHGGKGRTRMTKLKAKPLDIILVILFGAFAAGMIFINKITVFGF
ncbi:MAG: energy-coupling factor transporter transmembrane protein EcfT [Ruminococcaceae bacterium]|nr:energy-coupling factor transporter transmembrane protein EcfT [Oscillospiraceae bacterium]